MAGDDGASGGAAPGGAAPGGAPNGAAALPPQLVAAAEFVGMSESEVRDAIAVSGQDRVIAAIQNMVQRASQRWGLGADGQPAAPGGGVPAPQQPTSQPAGMFPPLAAPGAANPAAPFAPVAPPAPVNPNDPLASLAAIARDDYGKEFLEEFGDKTKPAIEGQRQLAKTLTQIVPQFQQAMQQQARVIQDLQQQLSEISQMQQQAHAQDLYDFYQEQAKTGFKGYGDVDAPNPLPTDLESRRWLFQAAKHYQKTSPRPISFKTALSRAHAARNVQTLLAAQQTDAQRGELARRQAGRSDVLPSSPGSIPAGDAAGDPIQSARAAATASLKQAGVFAGSGT